MFHLSSVSMQPSPYYSKLALSMQYTHTHTHTHTHSDVVRLERPDLEQQRNELIVNINKAKNELKVGNTHNHQTANHNVTYTLQ